MTNKPAKPRNAFDIPARSQVAQAVKPRQQYYKPGRGIYVASSAESRRDSDLRQAMRRARI